MPQYSLSAKQTHNKFSRNEKPVLTVKSGAVIEVFTEEATDAQLNINSTLEDFKNIKFDPVHPLTGPVYVEGAEPGDVPAVTLHHIKLQDRAGRVSPPAWVSCRMNSISPIYAHSNQVRTKKKSSSTTK